MIQEKIDLTWDTYTDHLREMLHDMMTSNEFTDVTLVTEDKKHFKAHKVVLSASSPVFKEIIKDNLSSSPLIYLRGIQSHEIEAILEFIYLGQAALYQERMNEFLNVAKNLEIKEINGLEIENPANEHVEDMKEYEFDQSNETPIKAKQRGERTKESVISIDEGGKLQCDRCNYTTANRKDFKRHVNSVHDGIKFLCDQKNISLQVQLARW